MCVCVSVRARARACMRALACELAAQACHSQRGLSGQWLLWRRCSTVTRTRALSPIPCTKYPPLLKINEANVCISVYDSAARSPRTPPFLGLSLCGTGAALEKRQLKAVWAVCDTGLRTIFCHCSGHMGHRDQDARDLDQDPTHVSSRCFRLRAQLLSACCGILGALCLPRPPLAQSEAVWTYADNGNVQPFALGPGGRAGPTWKQSEHLIGKTAILAVLVTLILDS